MEMHIHVSLQFSSVAESCPTLCDPMNCRTPGLPVHYQLPESTQTHVHWVGDAIQPSQPLSSPSPLALNLYQHQGFQMSQLFTSGGQSIGAAVSASVLPMNIQSWFPLGLTSLISLHNLLGYMLVYRASKWPWTVSTRGGSCLLVHFIFPVITGNTPKISQMLFLWS